MKRVVVLLGLAALLLGGVSAAAAPGHDFAAVALNVLPPGENGGVDLRPQHDRPGHGSTTGSRRSSDKVAATAI